MIIAVIVNSSLDIGAKQTTLRIIDVALRRGHKVFLGDILDLGRRSDGEVLLMARELEGSSYDSDEALIALIAEKPRRAMTLAESDLLLFRTNPGRDRGRWEYHSAALQLAAIVEKQGVRVVNSPAGLRAGSNKLYLLDLPESVRPVTLVSADQEEIMRFLRELSRPAVIKPTSGSRGLDVFRVESARDPNLRQLLDVVLRQGLAMVQEFVEGPPGDTRVLVLDGKLFEIDGRAAAFRRLPPEDNFRSNVEAGGRTAPAEFDEAMRRTVEVTGPLLLAHGMSFAGLDMIGDKIIEVNAFSPGGLRAAVKYEGVDFASAFWKHFESQ